MDIADEASGSGRKLLGSTTIDILMVYTPAAEAILGGENAAINKITASVAQVNTIYANSNIDVRLNLVRVAKVGGVTYQLLKQQ